MDLWQTSATLLGGVSTLAIFSFLVCENKFYRFFEHLFIGIAAGFGVIFSIKNFLWPQIMQPMLGLDIVTYPDGTLSKVYEPGYQLYLIPMAFGCLYYFIYSQKYNWLAKLVIGFSLGMSGGLAFKGFFAEMLPQLSASFKPLVVFSDGSINWGSSISNIIFVITLVAVMYYFFFSFRRGQKISRGLDSTGRWLMMVCFGAFFGSTVMARMALLVERLQFLIVDFYSTLQRLLGV